MRSLCFLPSFSNNLVLYLSPKTLATVACFEDPSYADNGLEECCVSTKREHGYLHANIYFFLSDLGGIRPKEAP